MAKNLENFAVWSVSQRQSTNNTEPRMPISNIYQLERVSIGMDSPIRYSGACRNGIVLVPSKSKHALDYLFILLLFSLIVFCGCMPPGLFSGGASSVTRKKWLSLEMHYGFVSGTAPIGGGDITQRSFVISGADLDFLERRFNPTNISLMSVGSYAKSKLTLLDGEVWLFMVIDPQDMRLCLESDRKLHYAVKFDDLQFYDALRELCWKNELTITPDVKIENIFLGFNGVHMHVNERPLVQPYQD